MAQFDDSFTDSKLKELRVAEEERSIKTDAPQLGFPYINLQDITPNPSAVSLINEKTAKEALAVGFDLKQKTLSLAAQDPKLPATQELIQSLERRKFSVVVYVCSLASLENVWARYADVVDSTAEKKGTFSLDESDMMYMMSEIKNKEDVAKVLKKIGGSNNTRRISQTLALMFAGALALGTSDIHIEPEETGVRLRYRLDGVLHDIVDLDSYIHKRLMSRLKLLSGMVLNVKIEAQDGRFTFNTGDRKVEVRSSIIPGAVGESMVMRLLDPSVASFSLDNIDMNPHIEKALREQLKRPSGLIITTGPTGSGKTTALYAFLSEVNEEGIKIITIENPVEYKLEGVMHTQTAPDYTFAQGLRAMLRQDPDVIMVGEIRDKEVAETAFHAAQTGHLVFSTLHTNSAVAGFARLVDLGVNQQIMGTSVNIIIGQRLVRLLCKECKASSPATQEETNIVKNVMKEHPYPIEVPEPLNLYHAVGCTVCGGTGFKGRQGVFEAVLMDEAVEEVVVRDLREHTILEAAKAQKIPNMIQDGMEKVVMGSTSIKELERVVEFPSTLSQESPSLENAQMPETEIKNTPELEDDAEFQSHIV